MRNHVPGWLNLLGLGITNAVCLAIGLGAGWGIDAALGTTPAFIFLGIIVGVAMGVAATWVEVRKFLRD
jgi:F0F1-type ATP synthase assembly protein I